MRLVLLLAGEGKRLMPYTKDRPKSLVEVNGKSLLKRQIDVLKSVGVTEIIAVTGNKSEQLHLFNFSPTSNFRIKCIPNYNYCQTQLIFS